MKEKLTLRNVVIWGAAFLGLLFFFLSFAVKTSFFMNDGGNLVEYRFNNGIWGANSFIGYVGGEYAITMSCEGKPYALPIIGLILVLVTVIAMVTVSFLVKSKLILRIVSISCGVLAIVGGIFMFFISETAIRTLCYMAMGSLDKLDLFKSEYAAAGGYWRSGALGTIMGVVFILVGASFGASTFLPEKKLAK